MIQLLTVIGARPQIIKAAALSRAIADSHSHTIEEHILHTGQHYDENMSQVFFDELSIPRPRHNLGVGSGLHGQQTARMIAGIEEVLLGDRYDGVVLYGDTNSTLAGAVAAAKLHIPVFHIEAGLRSFNMTMPEEVNRIVCDQLANICFAPTQTAMDNLRREGLDDPRATFANGRRKLLSLSGDIMYDNSLFAARVADQHCTILADLGIKSGEYLLATIHRDHNTDDPARLRSILSALAEIAEADHRPVVLPLHPRTKKCLAAAGVSLDSLSPLLRTIPPASYLEMTLLEKNARLVMTDSGGVQKEAFFFERPCIILRPETEWVEIVEHEAGIIADADHDRIVDAYQSLNGRPVCFPPLFGNGQAAESILSTILDYLQ